MFEFELKQTAISEKLQSLMLWMPQAVGNALRAEAEIEMTEAKKRTPVLTGSLRASGAVYGPIQQGTEISVKLAFGGPSAPYAVYVHEQLENYHHVGQAKFLESVLLESAKYMPDRIAARVKKDLGG